MVENVPLRCSISCSFTGSYLYLVLVPWYLYLLNKYWYQVVASYQLPGTRYKYQVARYLVATWYLVQVGSYTCTSTRYPRSNAPGRISSSVRQRPTDRVARYPRVTH